jgi:hypothetical protein
MRIRSPFTSTVSSTTASTPTSLAICESGLRDPLYDRDVVTEMTFSRAVI